MSSPDKFYGFLKASVDIKSSPEKFYGFLKERSFLIPVYSRGTTKSLKVDAEQTTPTELIYTTERFMDGKTVTMTECIEEDKENKSLMATLIEGDPSGPYRLLKEVFLIVPKEDGERSKANLSVEYEKRIKDVPTPDAFLTLLVQLTKDIDVGLTNEDAQNLTNKPADADGSSDDD